MIFHVESLGSDNLTWHRLASFNNLPNAEASRDSLAAWFTNVRIQAHNVRDTSPNDPREQ